MRSRNSIIQPNTQPRRQFRAALAAPGTAINAAALQSHFAQSLSLSMPDFRGNRRRKKRQSTNSNRNTTTNRNTTNSDLQTLRNSTRPWTCQHCTHINRGRVISCPACGNQRETETTTMLENDTNSTTTTSTTPTTATATDIPTLAQQRGLVPPPPSRLTKAEWDVAELTHEVRDAQRGMDETVCAICMERLSAGEQVILSCSHVYHNVCLSNFERFSKRKMDRSCPLCRCPNYQKKIYSPAQALLRKRSAVRIQTLFRKYFMKQGFQTTLQQHYSSGKGDRSRAHAFFADRVNKVSDKLVEALNVSSYEVDALVNESDRALELSRSIFASLAEDQHLSVPSNGADFTTTNTATTTTYNEQNSEGIELEWREKRRAAEKRGLCDCPICMTSLERKEDESANSPERYATSSKSSSLSPLSPVSPLSSLARSTKEVSLLSCTHVFHENCIQAFERFQEASNNEQHQLLHLNLCPVCRAAYTRRRLFDIELQEERMAEQEGGEEQKEKKVVVSSKKKKT